MDEAGSKGSRGNAVLEKARNIRKKVGSSLLMAPWASSNVTLLNCIVLMPEPKVMACN
jgi:hypothetical protein